MEDKRQVLSNRGLAVLIASQYYKRGLTSLVKTRQKRIILEASSLQNYQDWLIIEEF